MKWEMLGGWLRWCCGRDVKVVKTNEGGSWRKGRLQSQMKEETVMETGDVRCRRLFG